MKLHDLLTKAKQLARGRENQIDRGLDKAEQVISEKTGGKHDDKLKTARDKLDETFTGPADQSGDAERKSSDDRDTGRP